MRGLRPGFWCADNGYGEQFLNFNLHKELQKFCGVDLTQLFPKLKGEGLNSLVLGIWWRNVMGLIPSPHASVKGALRAKRIILGDHKNESNPFHWDRVETNLPGEADYDASKPWILILRTDGMSATELRTYINDLRTMAMNRRMAWAASSRIAETCSWLGLQDAARKRRKPSQSPGAWAGATASTDETQTYKSITQERWEKTQKKIRWLGSQLGEFDETSSRVLDLEAAREEWQEAPEGKMHFKTAESYRGFLVYVIASVHIHGPLSEGTTSFIG